MKPIKRLSFKRFNKIMESFPNGVSFGKNHNSWWGSAYSIDVNKENSTYEFSKNNGQFMEWFFDVKGSSIYFRYFAELRVGEVQSAYDTYRGEFPETANMLTLSKKLIKILPAYAQSPLDDFDELLSNFIQFIESGEWK